jgi:hypothetical protein
VRFEVLQRKMSVKLFRSDKHKISAAMGDVISCPITMCNICTGSGDVGLYKLATGNSYDDFCFGEDDKTS